MKTLPSVDPLVAETGCKAEKVCLQLRQSWRDSSVALQLCCDDFEKPSEKERSEAVSEGVKEVMEALEEAQLEDLQEETTEADIEAEDCEEGASLRQHHNETGSG